MDIAIFLTKLRVPIAYPTSIILSSYCLDCTPSVISTLFSRVVRI